MKNFVVLLFVFFAIGCVNTGPHNVVSSISKEDNFTIVECEVHDKICKFNVHQNNIHYVDTNKAYIHIIPVFCEQPYIELYLPKSEKPKFGDSK